MNMKAGCFLFVSSGRDLLVHPVTEEGARGVTAYLPGSGEVCGFLSV